MDRKEKLCAEYEQTGHQIRSFTDTRFKLLALVPTLTVAAITLLTRSGDQATALGGPVTILAVGLLGFFATLGIVFYEVRNIVLYFAAIDRAKLLEASLDLPSSTKHKIRGGLFTDRPRPPRLFEGLALFRGDPRDHGLVLRHDLGLALVYGAALGGWVYIVAISLFALLARQQTEANAIENAIAALLTAGAVALLCVRVLKGPWAGLERYAPGKTIRVPMIMRHENGVGRVVATFRRLLGPRILGFAFLDPKNVLELKGDGRGNAEARLELTLQAADEPAYGDYLCMTIQAYDTDGNLVMEEKNPKPPRYFRIVKAEKARFLGWESG